MGWIQKELRLQPRNRGFHLVTNEFIAQLPELDDFQVGLAHFFIQHTSAALALNENAEPESVAGAWIGTIATRDTTVSVRGLTHGEARR